MAKQGIAIQRFDGGVNNKNSKKDIPDGFLAVGSNIDISSIGQIKSLGKIESGKFIAADGGADASINVSTGGNIISGSGLFTFRTDEDIASGITAGEFFAYTKRTGEVFIGNATETMAEEFDINSDDPTHIAPVYYYANGGLRVHDSLLTIGFTANDYSKTTAFVYVPAQSSHQIYGSITAAYYDLNDVLTAPNMSTEIDALNTNPVPGTSVINNPAASSSNTTDSGVPTRKIKIGVDTVSPESTQGDGLFPEGTYKVGISYVYYDNQESRISEFADTVQLSDGQILLVNATIKDNAFAVFTTSLQADNSTANLLAGAITDSSSATNDINVDSGSVFSVGDTIKIDNEEMTITNISSNTLTVTRGANSTTKATHSDNAPLSVNYSTGKFIRGVRVYIKNIIETEEEYNLILDLDFIEGSRVNLGDEYDVLADNSGYMATHDATHGAVSSAETRAYALQNPSAATYSGINGFDLNEEAISFQENDTYSYNTATVANQRVFAGNVTYKDEDGVTKRMADRIQYSPVRKYDTFPQSYNIDVGTNDGDEIINIIEFQDKLFVYKKKKLFIIDISTGSDSGWTLVGEFENRGIENPGAVVKSDIGLIWVNDFGIFGYFDGIANLSSTIDESTWDGIVDAENVQVGFVPLKNQILIIGNADSTSSGGYLYDIKTQSFVNLTTSSVLKNAKVTNIVNFNNELCVMDSNGVLYKYNTTEASHTIDIQTKEYDFDNPSVEKRLLKVYITHKAGDNLTLTAKYDGESSFGNKFASNTLSDSATMTQSKFTVSTIEDCKSMQFKISGTAQSDFVLEDITVVYRTKGVR